ncbi:MAG: T9SS type A sorting domain-containing protein [Chloroherpetonaceae bacterium]|nr:T9SS type A sorting domain-containing protein [Chloroherpetonaceae bacterium]
MRNSYKLGLFIFIILTLTCTIFAQSVVINKVFYTNTANGTGDAVELLVIQNNLDMRGMIIKDYSSNMANDGGGKLIFNNNPVWQSVPSGTLIILRANSNTAADITSSDYSLDIGLTNTTYFTNDGGTATFDLSTNDFVQIKSSGSPTAGVTGNIHSYAFGTAGAQFTSVTGPKLISSAVSNSNPFSVATNPTQSLADFNGSSAVVGTGYTLGQGNNANNTAYINSLRIDNGARLRVRVASTEVNPNGTYSFVPQNIGQTLQATIQVRNTGFDTLIVSSITNSNTTAFSITKTSLEKIATGSSDSLVISFTPTDSSLFQTVVTFSSNDSTNQNFILNVQGQISAIRPISSLAGLPLGTVVTIAGRVTDGGKPSSPVYFQDGTGGYVAFETPLNTQSAVGDSLIITGPISEFTGGGAAGSGLRQISGAGITFQLIKDNPRFIEPKTVTTAQISDAITGQLVRIQNGTLYDQNNVNIFNGSFGGNANYTLRDASGSVVIRISNQTNLVNAPTPAWPTDVIGVVGRFNNVLQVLPRSTADLGVVPFVIPRESLSRTQTFEIVTWNLKWFGVPAQSGYTDGALQIANAARVIRTIDADVYALQEISEAGAFNTLLDSVRSAGYRGFIAPISQQQKTAYIFKSSTIDSVSAAFTFSTGDWATGRWPYEFTFDYNFGGSKYRVRAVNIHAKALDDGDSYARRVTDYQQLKSWADANRASDNLIILGDYNDEIPTSTFNQSNSPFLNFFNDSANYRIVTRFLSDRGLKSYSSRSFLDHITITNELFSLHLDSTQRVENTNYVGNYLSTTSDHYPVWTRFQFAAPLSAKNDALSPRQFELAQNYPNPFNPTTTIRYQLPEASAVRLTIYDVLGREVATLVNGRQNAGTYRVPFNASGLSSGVYFYKLTAGNFTGSKKMILVK